MQRRAVKDFPRCTAVITVVQCSSFSVPQVLLSWKAPPSLLYSPDTNHPVLHTHKPTMRCAHEEQFSTYAHSTARQQQLLRCSQSCQLSKALFCQSWLERTSWLWWWGVSKNSIPPNTTHKYDKKISTRFQPQVWQRIVFHPQVSTVAHSFIGQTDRRSYLAALRTKLVFQQHIYYII